MLTELRLKQFRSYSNDSFEFGPGVNIIVGPNASGKTNLLEAVLVVMRGSSYRGKDSELIQFDTPWARLDGRLESGNERTLKLVKQPPLVTKQFEIDGRIIKRLSMKNSLPVVVFEPDHLRLLSGGPERRRVYLDDMLEQTTPDYGPLRRRYRRTLAQRNALLKHAKSSLQTQLFPWNIRLSELAGQIVRSRVELINSMQDILPDLYGKLAGSKVNVRLIYGAQLPIEGYETYLLKKLDSSLEIDRMRGYTSTGPHREDMEILFDGHSAQETASRGETRTVVLACKIIELQLLEGARKTPPLLLLDDVFSELDGSRRHALTDYLSKYQTFITTTDADLILQHFTDKCNVIPLP